MRTDGRDRYPHRWSHSIRDNLVQHGPPARLRGTHELHAQAYSAEPELSQLRIPRLTSESFGPQLDRFIFISSSAGEPRHAVSARIGLGDHCAGVGPTFGST